jgi:hypothetical protein
VAGRIPIATLGGRKGFVLDPSPGLVVVALGATVKTSLVGAVPRLECRESCPSCKKHFAPNERKELVSDSPAMLIMMMHHPDDLRRAVSHYIGASCRAPLGLPVVIQQKNRLVALVVILPFQAIVIDP